MSSITGAKAAKRAAQAQEAAAKEAALQAQNQANEAAAQSAVQIAATSARETAAQQIEAATTENTPDKVEVEVGGDKTSLQRKRARFTPASGGSSIRI